MKKKVLMLVVIGLVFVWSPLFAAEKEPIKIGIPEKVTGPFASDGKKAIEGATMAVEEINTNGGLLGRPVEMIVFDIEDMTAEKVVAAAEQLVEKDKVVAAFTSYGGHGPEYRAFGKYDIPFFNYDEVTELCQLTIDNPSMGNVFNFGVTEKESGPVMMDVLLKFPYGFKNKNYARIAANWMWERPYTESTRDRALQNGWKVVMEEIIPYGVTDWRPLLTKIKKTQPSILHFEDLSSQDVVSFLRAFLQDPTDTLIFIGYTISIPEFMRLAGDDANGLTGYGCQSPWHFNPVKGKTFVERYEKRFNKKWDTSTPAGIYDAILHWAQAVKAVGDPRDFTIIVKELKKTPYEGVCGVYEYVPGNYVRASKDFPLPFKQVQNGKIVEIYSHLTPVAGTKFMMPPWIEKLRKK